MTGAASLGPAADALLAGLPAARRARHGIPDPAQAAVRTRAAAVAARVVGEAGDVLVSPLGPAWSRDVDVEGDLAELRRRATAAGWVPLDGWLAGIGSPARDVFAILEGEDVLGAADLSSSRAAPSPVPVAVAARARRRGEVRLREVLELLMTAGPAPAATGDAVVDAAVDRLARDPDQDPVALPRPMWRRVGATARGAVRPRLVVAVCGVDGAGKSTTAAALEAALERCGLPVGRVWARPGMNLGPLDVIVRRLKRAAGQSEDPGVRRVAGGDAEVASRRGVLGWVWSLLVVGAFATDVRRQHARVRGVALYDRHLADARVTIDVLYGGGDRRLQQWVAARALPRADVTAYLRVDVATAVARKPDDTIGAHAVAAQLERYESALAGIGDVRVLDGRQPVATSVLELLRAVPPPRGRPGRAGR